MLRSQALDRASEARSLTKSMAASNNVVHRVLYLLVMLVTDLIDDKYL